MSLTYVWIAAKIVLSGFVIYRIQKFLRTQRSWELGLTLLLFSILTFALALDQPQFNALVEWLPSVLILFLGIITFEPELADAEIAQLF